jgi:23S rRNA G2445 N2-methylase RlmL
MCGSGTLLIEAAWLSENRPPNLDRRFGFERWPGFRLDRLATIRHAAAEEIRVSDVTIAGSDRDRKIISAARANAERAGCGDRITLEGELGLDPGDRPGLLVANPPYGERMGDDREALRTYEALGKLLSTTFIGWRGAVLAKSEEQLRAMGLPITKRFPLKNGPLDILLGLVGPAGRSRTIATR